MDIDHQAARAFYVVAGSRVSGTLSVLIDEISDNGRRLESVTIDYGRVNDTDDRSRPHERPNRPAINGIRLVGGCHSIALARRQRDASKGWWVRGRREGGGPIPERTRC